MPVFATVTSVLFLGDRLSARLVVGGLVALVCMAVTQRRAAPSGQRREPAVLRE
jgi:O-acetylserine/cysteine efflux transporter